MSAGQGGTSSKQLQIRVQLVLVINVASGCYRSKLIISSRLVR